MSYPYGPPQPGYHPPGYHPPPYQGYPPAPMPARRSGIPRVIGIIAIVFSGFGLLMNIGMYAAYSEMLRDARIFGLTGEVGFFGTWVVISFALGFLVFALHLAGGIAATTYKRLGPVLITAYAVAALLLVIGDLIVAVAASPGESRLFQEIGQSRLGFAVMCLPWPVVALVLMNLRSAKDACGLAAATPEPQGPRST
jgi:hypothetical protein